MELNDAAGQRNFVENSSSKQKPQVSDIFTKTEIHGLPDWYEARERASKTTWTIILVFAVGFMVYELVKVSLDFKDNPILTTYSIVSEPRGLQFPEIYICPLIPIHQAVRKQKNVISGWEDERNVTEYFTPGAKSGGLLKRRMTIGDRVAQGRKSKSFPGGNSAQGALVPPVDTEEFEPEDLQDYFMNVGYSMETLFEECSFDAHIFECSSIVEPIFDRDYGKCFLMKTGQWHQQLPGIGLALVLNLDLDNATGDVEFPPLFDGAILKIHRDFDPSSYRKILLSPGQNIQLSLEEKRMKLMQRDRKRGGAQECVQSEIGRGKLKIMNWTYSLGICHVDCVQKEVWEHCGCVLAMDKRFFNAKIFQNGSDIFCDPTVKRDCADVVVDSNRNKAKSYAGHLEACINTCKFPCDLWEYRAEISSLKFPSRALLQRAAEKEAETANPPVYDSRFRAELTERIAKYFRIDSDRLPNITRQFENDPELAFFWKNVILKHLKTPPKPQIESKEIPPEAQKRIVQMKAKLEHNRPLWLTFERAVNLLEQIFRGPRIRKHQKDEVDSEIYHWQHNYIILDLAFSTLQYTEVTQESSMTFDTFISNVGGQVGLWIGASIVTVFKFFVILWPICFSRIKSCFQPKQNTEKQ